MNCQICGREFETLTLERCDECWDDFAHGRTYRKPAPVEAISLDPAQAGMPGRIQSIITQLMQMGPAGEGMAQAIIRAGKQFGPSPEVMAEIEEALKLEQEKKQDAERVRQANQHPMDAMIEARYITGDPSWKKIDRVRGRGAYRAEDVPIQGDVFGTVQEQIGPADVDTKNGLPIPGRKFREAYLQTHMCPPGWPEYGDDPVRKDMRPATIGEMKAMILAEAERLDAQTVTPAGALPVESEEIRTGKRKGNE